MTLRWPENVIEKFQKWSMLLKIQYKSTVFAKIDIKQHQNSCFSSCPQLLWNKSRSSFQTVENVSHSKPPPPGKESWAKTQPPRQWECANPRGSSRLGTDWKLNFQNIRVYVWSIPNYKFCLSMTLIVDISTLLLLSACRFFRGKIARNCQCRPNTGLQFKISYWAPRIFPLS